MKASKETQIEGEKKSNKEDRVYEGVSVNPLKSQCTLYSVHPRLFAVVTD